MEVQGEGKTISSELLYFLQYRHNANRSSRSGASAGWYYECRILSLWLLCRCAIRFQHIQLTHSKSVSKWHIWLVVSGLVAGLVLERNGSNTRTPNTTSQPTIGLGDCVRANDCGGERLRMRTTAEVNDYWGQ